MYVLVKNLKSKYADSYNWLYPVPGDWHIMKTTAEVIKLIIQDGGFRVLLGNVATRETYLSGRIFIT